VYLKNGKVVEGITEPISHDGIKVTTADGNTTVYKLAEIERIVRGGGKTVEKLTKVESVNPNRTENSREGVNTKGSENPREKAKTGEREDTRERDNTVYRTTINANSGNISYVVTRRDPARAYLYSVAVPGLGQMYNGQIGKGFIFLGVTYGCLVGGALLTLYVDEAFIFLGLGGLTTYIISVIDATVVANRFNKRNGFALGNGSYLNLQPKIMKDNGLATNWSKSSSNAYGMSLSISF